ncbi:MAG: DUF624 domain-containing protein [Lachnospiraceae bacterium]|nr:DUF624 domain-containing protein [Lachnospiraceae bacterium]
MANLLSPDSKVMTGINKVVDVIWISAIWSFFCLPVFWIFMVLSVIAAFGGDTEGFIELYRSAFAADPANNMEVLGWMLSDTYFTLMIEMLIRGVIIGPSTSALYYTMVKVIRRERGYATKTFFHGFKVNFKTGAPTSLIFVLFAILMVVDFRYVDAIQAESPTFSSVLNIALMVVSIFALLILVWIFPLLSRFTINLRGLFKNTMLISIRHFIGTFILAGGLALIVWLIVRFSGEMAGILIILPFSLPGGIALASSFIIEPVLKKYTGTGNKTEAAAADETADSNDDGTDENSDDTGSDETAEGEEDASPKAESEGENAEEENESVDEWYLE